MTADGQSAMPAPVVQTRRLVLDGHRREDMDALAAIWADPAVVGPLERAPLTREETWLRLLRHVGSWTLLGFGFWVVRLRTNDRIIGEVGFSLFERTIEPPLPDLPEAGWVLAAAAHGSGFAQEAMGAALGWADRTLEAPFTTCMIDGGNARSLRLAERLGYLPFGEASYHERAVRVLRRARAVP